MAGEVSSGAEPPLALYRRYRPATFAEVKGQEHVTEPLRQALRTGRVHHAYLFSGPRGCGKTSSARILARSLNCERGPTPDPCGVCPSCVALAPSGPGSIDVIEIDAASHGGIDDARDLRERAFYSPVSARYKIYIIDEAHMVTGAGFNALLKLVEEPPPHLKFVFATTEPDKVIPTIKSRTHHYPFRLVPPATVREILEGILATEEIAYEPAVLPVVVRAGAGSVRDALSVLDQLIAGADESGLHYDRAIALLGYTDDALLDEVAEALAATDGAAVFRAIDRVVEAGHDPRRFAMDLLDRLRDLIVLAAVPDAGATGLLDVPADRLDRMRHQASSFGQARLVRAAETVSAGLIEMRGATSPRLLLELMCAQVLLPAEAGPAGGAEPATGLDDLMARVDRLERRMRQPEPAPPRRLEPGPSRPTPARPPAEEAPQPAARAAPPPGPAADVDLETLRKRWPDVLDAVRRVRKVAWILLSEAAVDTLEGNVLTLAFEREGNAKGFATSGCDQELGDVLAEMFGVRPVVRAVVRPGAGRGGQAVASGGPGPDPGAGGPDMGGDAGPNRGGRPSGPGGGSAAGGRRSAADGTAPGKAGSQDHPADDAASPPEAGAAAARESTGRTANSRGGGRRGGAGSAGSEGSAGRTSSVPLADDPRQFTDAAPGGSDRELIGSDLVMRELGGRIIGEVDGG
jgi:DNA polymerase III subunit gamma/tau